jgi:hypothetical protein
MLKSPHPRFANALPYLFDGRAIERAAARLEASLHADQQATAQR